VTDTSSLTEDGRFISNEIARFRAILFDMKLKPDGLTMSQVWVLANLWRENGLRQAERVERVDIATVTTSKPIDHLQANGFVKRTTDAEDRRSNRIVATQKGLALAKAMTKIVHEVDAIASRVVSKDDLAAALEVVA
jgi:DNA-binding MarR family transcriptional regulator